MQNKRKITGYIVVTAPFTSGENWIIEKRCTTYTYNDNNKTTCNIIVDPTAKTRKICCLYIVTRKRNPVKIHKFNEIKCINVRGQSAMGCSSRFMQVFSNGMDKET